MKLIQAIVRPEMAREVIVALEAMGHNAYSKVQITGRGRQKGIQVGETCYDEIVKTMLYLVVDDEDKNDIIDVILDTACTGDSGSNGDGKIFVTSVEESYTISKRVKDN